MSLLSRLAVQAARAYGMLAAGSANNVSADYLVVAGGASGGMGIGGVYEPAGGGGAGGMLTSTATLSTLNTYTITVGAGGAARTSSGTGNAGSNSVISGTGLTTITSIGGGGGSFAGNAAGSGGSGGGASANTSGGAGTAGQGNNGGNSTVASPNFGCGGGGGAGAVGGNGSSTAGGAGGAGSSSSISGSSVTYAGGGGGGSNGGTAGSGGSSIGGAGSNSSSSSGSSASANTGSGGGGGGGTSSAAGTSGSGGSGIVIISYTSATPKFVGGTITTSGGKQIHTFTSSGTLSPITPITASYLVVAGGAGGGFQIGGGGGAGGYKESSTTLYSGATYVVTVGAGGAGDTASGGSGSNGSNSELSGTGLTTITSTGGGGGASNSGGTAQTGGSGGGGRGSVNGAAGTSGQGFAGGNGSTDGSTYTNAGGGGGASAVGSNATASTGGNGGTGTASSITGTSTTYAGGGGGGAQNGGSRTAGTATGGGGAGGLTGAGSSGTPNLGAGGGGGGENGGTGYAGGNGGSGIVIISYAGSQAFNGGLVTTSGGNTIHTFTSSGALTPLTNNLNNSLRFRSSASAYLSRTFASTGTNNKIQTFSAWVKRGLLSSSANYRLMGCYNGSSSYSTEINFSNDSFRIEFGGSAAYELKTTQVFRDPSAWYHFVIAIDTTQATAANRIKMYVNGNQITAFATANYPAQNDSSQLGSATANNKIGANWNTSGAAEYFDGYMTDINFIDGQALEPYYFGNNDANGVWKPIQYKGTYGTNGFYLTFGNTTSTTTLGYDSSPNGNNWTCNNISLTAGTTYDAMTDVPTNTSATVANYAVWNPLDRSNNTTYSQANLYAISTNNSSPENIQSTIQFPLSGKFYCEITGAKGAQDPLIGIGNNVPSAQFAGYRANGSYLTGGISGATASGSGATWTTGDVIGIAYDIGAGTITFYKNGVAQTGGFTGIPATGYFIMVRVDSGVGGDGGYLNCGQRPFAYTPPTGFVALNTFNLPTPTILQGNKYMDATLYTGNGSGQTIVNQGQFYPDLIWVKSRSNATNNNLFTSVLSGANILKSNSTDGVVGVTNAVTAFNSNGFTLGSDSGSIGVNINSNTYVAWQWLAGATTGTTTNTNGSITSFINVNTTAGFSQVYWTGTAANGTLGHGLGVAPKMIITKCRGASTDWAVYHASIGNTGALRLNLTAVTETDSRYWNNTSPTSTVWSVGSSNPSNAATAMVAYVWAEIAGFSAFGSYTGNGSADGPFVYTGFRPKFVLTKRTDGAGDDWTLFDTARNTYNLSTAILRPNTSQAELSSSMDLLSNGFKWKQGGGNGNESGGTYIFMAFAENPFKNANAR